MERTSSEREQEANSVQTEARLRWLLLRGLSGDKVGYREFLAATAMHLRAFFGRRLIHRSGEVEGLVQKALTSIHNRRGSYSAHMPVTAWIFAIAQHELGIYMHGPPRSCTIDVKSQSLPPAMKSPGLVDPADGSVFTASEHAAEGITKSAALESAPGGVRVNAVAPGLVATEMPNRFDGGDEQAKAGLISMIPAERATTPDEVMQRTVFLANDKAHYPTGQSVAVDGSFLAQ